MDEKKTNGCKNECAKCPLVEKLKEMEEMIEMIRENVE